MLIRELCAVVLCVSIVIGAHYAIAAGEQIQIHADSMQLDINSGDSIYQGNVSFVQGNIELTGSRVIVSSKNGEIIRVNVEGMPAHYNNANANGSILAESETMEYVVAENRLSMLGDARLEQDDRVVQSHHIIYDTKKQVILAGKSTSGESAPNERVNITLTPRKDKTP